jgi:hypothetical protein
LVVLRNCLGVVVALCGVINMAFIARFCTWTLLCLYLFFWVFRLYKTHFFVNLVSLVFVRLEQGFVINKFSLFKKRGLISEHNNEPEHERM